MQFDSMNFSPTTLRAIEALGYSEMTPIQEAAIPLLLEGRDVIGRSATGTGKTAAFGLPIIERTAENAQAGPQALILCPTRELCMQICEELRKFAKYRQGVGVVPVYGGQSIIIQIRQMKKAAIVVGTPGRVIDHLDRRTLRLDHIKTVVLDEADEMLNMGFLDDMKIILRQSPDDRQTVLFSATMPPQIMDLTAQFQKDAQLIAVDGGRKTLETIRQHYFEVPQSRKVEALKRLIEMYDVRRGLIFCNTKKMVDSLLASFEADGVACDAIHGDMKQAQRTVVMSAFKRGTIRLLIATDVAARGIDAQDVDAVINYDLPLDLEYYVHRIGRTGRAGKEGAAYTFIANRAQYQKLLELQEYLGIKLTRDMLPGFVCFHSENERPVFQEDERPARRAARAEKARPVKASAVLNAEKPLSARAPSAPASGRSIVRLDLGRNARIAPNFIVGAITEATGLPAKSVGKIEIHDDHSTVEMTAEDAAYVLSILDTCRIKGKSAHFTVLTADKNAGRRRAPMPEGKSRPPRKTGPQAGRPQKKKRYYK